MRQVTLMFGLGVLLIAGAIATQDAWRTAAQDDDEELTVRVLSYMYPGVVLNEGDECRMPLIGDGVGGAVTGGKVVVRDASGAIITASDEIWSTYEFTEGSNTLVCQAETTIALPESTFYEIYWGDEWLTVYRADQLPLDAPLEIVVNFIP